MANHEYGVEGQRAPLRAGRRPAGFSRRNPTLAAAFLGGVSLLGYGLLRHFLLHLSMVDLVVYRAEGHAVLADQDLYAMRVLPWQLSATYPPFAALAFTGLAWIPVAPARALVTLGNVGLLGLFALLACRLAGWPARRLQPAVAILAACFGVWLEPVWTTLNYGQINILLSVLVLWDLTRSDSSRSKGIAIGIAAGIKLTPGLFALYLLFTGRVRAALVAGAASLGTVLLGWLALPNDSMNFWTKDLFDTGRVGKTWIVDNQSLRGALARLFHTADPGAWAVVATAAVGVLGLAVATACARRSSTAPRAEAWGVLCCAITGLLVSPISWSHHWVWCVPVIILLAAEASAENDRGGHRRMGRRTTLAVTVTAFTCQCLWVVPQSGDGALHLPYWEMPFAAVYPLAGLAFLGVAWARVLRRPRPIEARSGLRERVRGVVV
ncbi:alpha-1,2-mannosyltransferase [Streptacidiphilus sp. MAP12-16]|uniref:glycosyltransferase 87 family protein n=1 Tax=Streptacidiphilus sp. MAP12-16 TaxID=3156300 RepID=UPI0035144714